MSKIQLNFLPNFEQKIREKSWFKMAPFKKSELQTFITSITIFMPQMDLASSKMWKKTKTI